MILRKVNKLFVVTAGRSFFIFFPEILAFFIWVEFCVRGTVANWHVHAIISECNDVLRSVQVADGGYSR
jgi:hypothetical protein